MILFYKSLLCSWYPIYVYAEKYSCKVDAVLYFAWSSCRLWVSVESQTYGYVPLHIPTAQIMRGKTRLSLKAMVYLR